MLVWDSLWGGVNLLLSLSLTTIKAGMDGDDTFVFNTAVNDEIFILEELDTVLKGEVTFDFNLGSKDKLWVRKLKKPEFSEK
jgi:hypothetical protein